MKNEQSNPKSEQDQTKNTGNNSQRDSSQQQGGSRQPHSSGGSDTANKSNGPSSQNSNISVGNDGKIGKAQDQWKTGQSGNDQQYDQNQRGNDQGQRGNSNQQNTQMKADRSVSEPEIDNPAKPDQKIPQTQGNKDKR
jgi:hypothetical protein